MNHRLTKFLCGAIASFAVSGLVNSQPTLPDSNKIQLNLLPDASNSFKRNVELGKTLQSDNPRLTTNQLQLRALQRSASGSYGKPGINDPRQIFPNIHNIHNPDDAPDNPDDSPYGPDDGPRRPFPHSPNNGPYGPDVDNMPYDIDKTAKKRIDFEAEQKRKRDMMSSTSENNSDC